TGSVAITGLQIQAANPLFQLSTVPDASGNGRIVLNGFPFINASGTSSILLNSSESGSGAGGISVLNNNGDLKVTNLTLLDGVAGSGNGSIGSSISPIITGATNLTARTNGSVFIDNFNSVTLAASNAGANQTFSLTASSSGNGSNGAQITVAGNVSAGTIT